MADLLFKRGKHANLPAVVVDGAFYLTTDTHRLYAGITPEGETTAELVSLNKYILTYTDLDDLKQNWGNATVGDFAYVEKENVLAYYDGANWHQINQNTDTTLQRKKDGSADGFAISGVDSSVTLTITESDGTAHSDAIAFTGANGISTAVADDGTVTITGTVYDLSGALDNTGAIFTITLDNDRSELDSYQVDLNAGSNIEFTGGENTLTISAKDTTLDSDAGSLVIESVKTGDNITGSKVTFSVEDTDGNVVSKSSENTLYYTVNGTTVYNQDELPVYSKDQIDTKFNQLNPMSYKGVVTTLEGLTGLENVKAGDTYMVSGSGFDGPNQEGAKKGDLFIATGEETDDGVLTDVIWTYVPAGDDAMTDTTYSSIVTVSDHKAVLVNDLTEDVVYGIDLEAGDKIELSSVEDPSGVLKTTIKHAAPGAASIQPTDADSTSDNTYEIIVPEAFVIDEYGHVAGFQERTYNVAKVTLEGDAVTAVDNVATVVTTLTDSNGDSRGTATMKLDASAADNLNITATGTDNVVVLKLEWGTF